MKMGTSLLTAALHGCCLDTLPLCSATVQANSTQKRIPWAVMPCS